MIIHVNKKQIHYLPEFDTPRTENVQQVLDLGPLLNETLAEIETAR